MPLGAATLGASTALPAILQSIMGGQQVAPAAPAFNTPQNPVSTLGLPGANTFTPEMMDQDLMSSLIGSPLKKPPKPGDKTIPDEGPGFFNNFFNTLDSNLQSPSKVLGLSLLSRLDPRLGAAGLLGAGFLGQ